MTAKQLGYIAKLAEAAVSFYEDFDDLDELVVPIYGRRVHDLNIGQASMLINDLLVELGESEEVLTYPSIFTAKPHEKF